MHPHWKQRAKQPLWRTALKTIIYRVVSAASTIGIAGLVFGNWAMAGAFGVVDLIANTVIYFTFERFWAHISWRQDNGQKKDH